MKSLFIIVLNIFVVSFLMACNSSNSKRLEQALLFAGDNRGELEKVLTHYENNPEKLEAAKFLIRNMLGSYAVDSMIEKRYTPFYLMYDSLSLIYNENFPKERGLTIDSLWENYGKNIGGHFSFNYTPDLNVINADQLIAEGEHAELELGGLRHYLRMDTE